MLAALSLVVEREMVNCQFKLSVSWHFSVPHRTPPAKFSAQGQPWVYLRQRVNAREMRDELGTQLSPGTSLAMVKNLQEIQRKDTETHNGKTTAKKRKKKNRSIIHILGSTQPIVSARGSSTLIHVLDRRPLSSVSFHTVFGRSFCSFFRLVTDLSSPLQQSLSVLFPCLLQSAKPAVPIPLIESHFSCSLERSRRLVLCNSD